ncbi:MAG: metalloprotease PmbA [Chromatiales bacterium]|nr:metalloprotease PmbA [Chromatiales bacterium]
MMDVPEAVPALVDSQPLLGRLESALEFARTSGADAAQATIAVTQGTSVGVRLGELESVEYDRAQSLSVTVYFGHREGSASTSDLGREALRETVEAACAIARYTAEDPHGGLPRRDDLAENVPDLDLDHPWLESTDKLLEVALCCEQAARDAGPMIRNSDGASVNSHRSLRCYANSLGFAQAYGSSRHGIGCAVIAGASDEMQRGHWGSSARRPSELEDAGSVGHRAAQRAIEQLGARTISTRTTPVVFPADLAYSLWASVAAALSGSAQYRKTSFLQDCLGQSVASRQLRLYEQPFLPAALGSAPFDDEGVSPRERDLLADGEVRGYVLNSYSARRLGMRTTGNAGGVRNLTLEPGADSFAELLGRMDTGFLVTGLMGRGVNPLTGDYSRGARGFWVEGGEIAFPVHEVTLAGNLRILLKQIVAIGNDPIVRGNYRSPSVLVEAMTLGGKSG